MRENPKLHEDYKQKAKNRYYSNKRELSARDRREKTKYERERKRQYRARKKDNIDIPATSADPEIPASSYNVPSHQSIRGKKISARKQRECYHDNFKLRDQNQKLKSKLKTAQKKISRLKAKNVKIALQSDDVEASVDNLLSETNKNKKTIRTKLVSYIFLSIFC